MMVENGGIQPAPEQRKLARLVMPCTCTVPKPYHAPTCPGQWQDIVADALAAEAQREREACAKLAEDESGPGEPSVEEMNILCAMNPADVGRAATRATKKSIAAKIRARYHTARKDGDG